MMNVISAKERFLASNEWYKSYNLFSSGNYYDPSNTHFGPLRTFNDTYLAPKGEIPEHPHADKEILTIVLAGTVTHLDSLGNDREISRGGAFRLSTGTGMTHSLVNNSDKDEVHFLQLFFEPNTVALNPSFEQREIGFLDASDELYPIATGQKVLEDVLFINSNSTVYFSNLGNDKDIRFNTFDIRQTFFYMLEGSMFVNGVQIEKHDQLRLEKQDFLTIKASADASYIMIDLPAVEANY
jgi:quercetin 2,3-dioxygenase